MPLSNLPFPLALGPGKTPAVIAAAEKYFRDRGLVFAVVMQGQVPYNARDLISGIGPTTPAPGKLAGYSPLGVGMVTDATNSGSLYATPAGLPSTFSTASMLWVGVPSNAIAGTFLYMCALGNTSGDPDISIGYDVTNTRFNYLESSNGLAAVGSSPLGPLYSVVVTKSGLTKKMYVNGVLVFSGSGSATRPRGVVGIGRQGGSVFTYGAATHVACAVWNRTLSGDEAIDLSLSTLRAANNPLPFRSQYFALSGGTILTTGLGSADFTGYSPSLIKTLGTGTGTLAATGFAPKLGLSIGTGLGAGLFSGYAPSLGFKLTTGVGAGLFTGYSPRALVGANLQTGSGVGVFTGYAPTVTITDLEVDLPPYLPNARYYPRMATATTFSTIAPIAASIITELPLGAIFCEDGTALETESGFPLELEGNVNAPR